MTRLQSELEERARELEASALQTEQLAAEVERGRQRILELETEGVDKDQTIQQLNEKVGKHCFWRLRDNDVEKGRVLLHC